MLSTRDIVEVSLSSLNGFLNISLGIFLLMFGYLLIDTSKRDKSIFWFSLISFSAGAWALSTSVVDLAVRVPILPYLSSGIIPILLLAFSRSLVGMDNKYSKVWNLLFVIGLIVLVYVSLPGIGMISYPEEGLPISQLGSLTHIFFSVYLLVYFSMSIGVLLRESILNKIKRNQIIVALFGIIFAIIWAAIFSLVIPLVYQDSSLSRIGAFGLLVMNSSIAYLVLKQKFLQVDALLFRLFLLVLTVLIVLFFELSLQQFGVRSEISVERAILLGSMIAIVGVLIRTVLVSSKLANNLQSTNISLQQEVDDKMMFLQISSHQLRTPTTAISGYIERVYEHPVSPNVGIVLPKMRALILSLEDIISDLLSVNSISSGSFRLGTFRPAQAEDMIANIIAEKEFLIQQAGADVSVKTQGKIFGIVVDRVKLQQSLVNVIENAIEYGGGKVEISLIAHRSTIEIRVKDYGIGIPKEKIAWIFEKYSRDEAAIRLRPDGSGVGLYLAKLIIEGHGGEIGVESKGNGEGSEFWIILPKYHG